METIQVVLDEDLLNAADAAARNAKINRSALMRDALKAHLRKLKILEMEERERQAYLLIPDDIEETKLWEAEIVWPEE